MKILKIIGIVLLLAILGLVGQKVYLTQKYKSYQPKYVSQDEISDFVDKHPLLDINDVYRLKSDSNYTDMDNVFGPGKIYIFDKEGKVLDNNISSEKGTCHADLVKKMCKGEVLINQQFEEKLYDRFDKLKQNILRIDGDKFEPNDADIYICFGWAIYFPVSTDDVTLKFIECAKKNYPNASIIAINFDLQQQFE